MHEIRFLYPYILLVFPILLLCIKFCPQKEDALLFSNTKLLSKSIKKVSFIDVFKITSIFFLILSLSSPYLLKKYKQVKKDSIQITLVIDISLSMQESFKKVKKDLIDFLTKRNSDHISLLYFADKVAIASPNTTDISFLKKSIQDIKVGSLGEMDTYLYDALSVAVLLEKDQNPKNITILLTDGIDKGSKTTLHELINILQKTKTTLYTIGYKEDYDKDVLKTLATLTHGKYFEAKLNKLQITLEELNKLYPKKDFEDTFIMKEPLYQIPLFMAFLSLLFYTYLLNKRAVV